MGKNFISRIARAILIVFTLIQFQGIYCQDVRVFGGSPADVGEYPWMVALADNDSSTVLAGQFCGGALIDSIWVLTAAHCVFFREPERVDVVLNVVDLENTEQMEIIGVDSIFIYPHFGEVQGINLSHDVALLKLESPSNSITTYIPVVNDIELDQPADSAWFTGWGYTEQTTTPSQLMEVEFPIVPNSVCLDPQWDISEMYSADIQKCAGDPIAGEGIFSEDSGGPLMVKNDQDQFILVGVLSAAIDWDVPSYGVFCRLFEYRNWITGVMNTDQTVNINFTNRSNLNLNIGDSLRVEGYFPLIQSGDSRAVSVNTPLQIDIYKQVLSDTLQHHHWNNNNYEYLMKHNRIFESDDQDYTKFLSLENISVTNSPQQSLEFIDLHDPWYAYQEDGEWIQPDEFKALDELTSDGTYNVFTNQGGSDINDLIFPYYSIRTPGYVTDGSDTYMFDGWSGTNVSFNELAPETPVVSHQPGAEIIANYVLVSNMNQAFSIPPGFINMISFNVLPDNPAIASIFSGVTNIMIQDDNGGFFVPSFSIDTIGDVDIVEGYKIDYWDSETINLSVPGLPTYSHTEITINGNNSMNYFPYLSQDPMDIDEAFEEIVDDILIVQSDMSGYYVPIYNINSIYTLLPGESYYFTSNISDPIKFRLPRPATPRQMSEETLEEKLAAMVSQNYHPIETGNSFPILIEGLEDISVGDEIVAYSNGITVGATRIANPNDPILVVVWKAIQDEYRILPGFTDGEELDLRLWDQDRQVEISLTGDMVSHPYGEIELLSGEMTLGSVVTPLQYRLCEAFPNPFNPTTNIAYELPENGMVNIVVYDMIGREVTQLVNSVEDAGYHSVIWDASKVASGTYLVNMHSGTSKQTQKIMLVK